MVSLWTLFNQEKCCCFSFVYIVLFGCILRRHRNLTCILFFWINTFVFTDVTFVSVDALIAAPGGAAVIEALAPVGQICSAGKKQKCLNRGSAQDQKHEERRMQELTEKHSDSAWTLISWPQSSAAERSGIRNPEQTNSSSMGGFWLRAETLGHRFPTASLLHCGSFKQASVYSSKQSKRLVFKVLFWVEEASQKFREQFLN